LIAPHTNQINITVLYLSVAHQSDSHPVRRRQ